MKDVANKRNMQGCEGVETRYGRSCLSRREQHQLCSRAAVGAIEMVDRCSHTSQVGSLSDMPESSDTLPAQLRVPGQLPALSYCTSSCHP